VTRTKSYVKPIACVEGYWDNWRDDSTVRPLLEILNARTTGFRYLHRQLSTEEELSSVLSRVGKSPSYALVYFAFHGSNGDIYIEDVSVSLERLGEMFGQRYIGRIVHFSSCSTLKCHPDRINAFLSATGVAMISGYTKDVDWIESAAFELLYFDLWQQYKDIGAFTRRITGDYSQLIERLGFVFYKP
jgi:hypothetical protein